MTIEFVNNDGPNSVRAIFKRLSASATRLDAVSAFATRSGVDAVLPYIRRIADRGHVSLTVGLYQGITEPSALQSLRKAAKAYPKSLVVSVATNPSLHRKVYAFYLPGRTWLLVGSSNLTDEGLHSDGEFNALIRFPAGKADFKRFLPELADSRARVPLTAQLISDYERARSKPRSGITRSAVAGVLGRRGGKTKKRRPRSETPPEFAWLRTFISGGVTKKTEGIVDEQTGWDDKGWSWCTVDHDDRVSIGDYVLMFDYSKLPAWAQVFRVKGVTRTALPTPDGRHFFAYMKAPGFKRRRIGKSLWDALAASGLVLNKERSMATRSLASNARRAVDRVFKP